MDRSFPGLVHSMRKLSGAPAGPGASAKLPILYRCAAPSHPKARAEWRHARIHGSSEVHPLIQAPPAWVLSLAA
jgi:hypothetical protein